MKGDSFLSLMDKFSVILGEGNGVENSESCLLIFPHENASFEISLCKIDFCYKSFC